MLVRTTRVQPVPAGSAVEDELNIITMRRSFFHLLHSSLPGVIPGHISLFGALLSGTSTRFDYMW